MTVNRELRDYFLQEVAKAMGFLVTRHHFVGPEYETDEDIHFARVSYSRENLAIECVLDEREEDVDCKVVRMKGGRRLVGFAVDEKGQLVRQRVSTFVRSRGAPEPLFRKVGNLSLRQRIPITLNDYARLLKNHGQEILADSPTVFDVPKQSNGGS
jgi:hypothetical protein